MVRVCLVKDYLAPKYCTWDLLSEDFVLVIVEIKLCSGEVVWVVW